MPFEAVTWAQIDLSFLTRMHANGAKEPIVTQQAKPESNAPQSKAIHANNPIWMSANHQGWQPDRCKAGGARSRLMHLITAMWQIRDKHLA